MKHCDFRVQPWLDYEEWSKVKDLIASGHLLKAKNIIEIWNHRVPRLDSGVETTYCLIEAILLKADEGAHALTLASSINRFLNLITHAGMNMFNLSKYHDVAKVMRIPRWIVDVRHETNHGQMPSYIVLKSAVSYCFKWIVNNYWEYEDTLRKKEASLFSDIRNYGGYEQIYQILDCYKYLRIYSIWGNKYLEEIKDQEEIYSFLEGFISDIKLGQPKSKKARLSPNNGKTTIHESAVYVRNKIHKLISVNHDSDTNALIHSLTHDQLMLPHDELLISLKENTDKEILPENLIKVWKDVVSMLHQGGLLPKLATSLVKVMASTPSGSLENQLALKWIEKFIDPLTGVKSKTWLSIKPSENEFSEGKWNGFVEAYIMSNHPTLTALIDKLSIFRHPPLTKDQCNKIKRLTSICQTADIDCSEPMAEEWDVKTLEDVHFRGENIQEVDRCWKVSSHIDWSSVPLGHFVPAQEDLNEEVELEPFLTSEHDEVVSIVDWESVMLNAS